MTHVGREHREPVHGGRGGNSDVLEAGIMHARPVENGTGMASQWASNEIRKLKAARIGLRRHKMDIKAGHLSALTL